MGFLKKLLGAPAKSPAINPPDLLASTPPKPAWLAGIPTPELRRNVYDEQYARAGQALAPHLPEVRTIVEEVRAHYYSDIRPGIPVHVNERHVWFGVPGNSETGDRGSTYIQVMANVNDQSRNLGDKTTSDDLRRHMMPVIEVMLDNHQHAATIPAAEFSPSRLREEFRKLLLKRFV